MFRTPTSPSLPDEARATPNLAKPVTPQPIASDAGAIEYDSWRDAGAIEYDSWRNAR